jgi:hypothetical protein
VITAEYVRELFDLNPDTGHLYRRDSLQGRMAGSRAGKMAASGYRRITIDGVDYPEHRIVWLHFYGANAPKIIDHKNCCRSDNRISNLRAATHAQNITNSKSRDNQYPRGVRKTKSGFAARIGENGNYRYLGHFKTVEEAASARRKAEQQFHGEFVWQGGQA